jgi:hypothetical protein
MLPAFIEFPPSRSGIGANLAPFDRNMTVLCRSNVVLQQSLHKHEYYPELIYFACRWQAALKAKSPSSGLEGLVLRERGGAG